MIACKRITALAIFFRGCNQSNPSSVRVKIKQNFFISNYSAFFFKKNLLFWLKI
tara:strand:- start:272 stop:433 length:162 start_codon:yes stop_codon:yes gene_type:complete